MILLFIIIVTITTIMAFYKLLLFFFSSDYYYMCMVFIVRMVLKVVPRLPVSFVFLTARDRKTRRRVSGVK